MIDIFNLSPPATGKARVLIQTTNFSLGFSVAEDSIVNSDEGTKKFANELRRVADMLEFEKK